MLCPRRISKLATFLFVAWFCVMIYIGMTLYQLAEESKKSALDLNHISLVLKKLKTENSHLEARVSKAREEVALKLRNRKSDIPLKYNEADADEKVELKKQLSFAQMKIKNLEDKLLVHVKTQRIQGNQQKDKAIRPALNYEKLRRRVSNQIKEMWFLMSGQYKKLRPDISEKSQTSFDDLLIKFSELQAITELDFDELVNINGVQKTRDNLAAQTSELVQQRIHKMQNPKDCKNARKLVCRLDKGCGYGCQMHHVMYCFIVAFATERTLIIDSSHWRYSAKGWNAYFKPVSESCIHYTLPVKWSSDHEKHQVIVLPIVDTVSPRPKHMPQSVPRDLYDQIRLFHGHPFVWWIGQFCKHLFRYSLPMQEHVDARKKKLGFKSPIVGVHVRRTDKINLEAAYHGIEEYMYWVDRYYEKLALKQKVDKKRVFLATDDDTVLNDAKERYPSYEFLSDNDVSKSASVRNRYSDLSLKGVVSDIDLLSESDFLVCTFSSQVCRMGYELMNYKHTDASQRFRSLDDMYYFGGQNAHRVKAIWPHKAKGGYDKIKKAPHLNLKVNEILKIAGNHWDGESLARSMISQREGLYPSYKVENLDDVEDFPTYTKDR